MKKIVQEAKTEIKINDLNGKEVIAYKSRGNHICVLTAFMKRTSSQRFFGFINLAYTDGDATYLGDSFYASIHAAITGGKEVFAFADYDEFILAIRSKML